MNESNRVRPVFFPIESHQATNTRTQGMTEGIQSTEISSTSVDKFREWKWCVIHSRVGDCDGVVDIAGRGYEFWEKTSSMILRPVMESVQCPCSQVLLRINWICVGLLDGMLIHRPSTWGVLAL